MKIIFYLWRRLKATQAELNAFREIHAEEVGKQIASYLRH